MHLALVIPLLLSPCIPLSAQTALPPIQSQPHPNDLPIFHAQTQLVLIDVLAQDPKTGLPLNTLKREDFVASDNQQEVPIATFDAGAHFSVRPIALWFVVICNERGRGEGGEFASGWFSGKEVLFRPALNDLDKNDRAGVAHWCDNGDAQLDLRPTQDHDAIVTQLTKTLQPMDYDAPPSGQTRGGELTLQRLVRMILDDTRETEPQPLPVLLFLHTDKTGMPIKEVDALADDLLETSGFAFGMKDADALDSYRGILSNGEQGGVLHYIAAATGGQYFSIHPDMYSIVLQSILLQLHFRYQLGFKPPAIDGKRHSLTVKFTGSAKHTYKSVRLRYRPEYIPSPKRERSK
jgi:hypothetical protein